MHGFFLKKKNLYVHAHIRKQPLNYRTVWGKKSFVLAKPKCHLGQLFPGYSSDFNDLNPPCQSGRIQFLRINTSYIKYF